MIFCLPVCIKIHSFNHPYYSFASLPQTSIFSNITTKKIQFVSIYMFSDLHVREVFHWFSLNVLNNYSQYNALIKNLFPLHETNVTVTNSKMREPF